MAPDDTYEKALEEEGIDLVAAAGELPQVLFRDAEIQRALEWIDAGRSVLIIGEPGVGKTALIGGIARAMAARGHGALRQLSTATFLAGTRYIGEWQTKSTRIADAAAGGDVALYVDDAWNLPQVGRTAKNEGSLWDVLRPFVDARRVRLIAEATSEQLLAIRRVASFANAFDVITVPALAADQVAQVIDNRARAAALTLDPDCRRSLIDLTSRFMPARAQPGPALRLLAQAIDYQAQKRSIGEPEPVTTGFVERVFSIYSGLPMFIVSRQQTMPAREIRAWFESRIVGQRDAIAAVVEAIALFKAGLHDPHRPLGTFLFVGPTGVGKTELARALAEFLFGSRTRLLRFDLSEFKDYHSFELLIGKPEAPAQEARLIDPVRAQPFHIVLFDELEKAHANVWDLLLPLLDEGQLTPPGGRAVNFASTMIIATSNVGARESARSLGFGAEPDTGAREAKIRAELEHAFRPELLNRFQHIVIFHPLSRDQVRSIARHELTGILSREGITGRNLVVDVSEDALDLVIERGFEPRYGARALKRELQRQIVLPLAMTLMEREIEPGAILRVVADRGEIRVRVLDTEATRDSRREREPVRTPDGDKVTRADLTARHAAHAGGLDQLARDVDETFLRAERDRIEELRREPEFWNYSQDAALALRDLDRVAASLDRLDRLRGQAQSIGELLSSADLRRQIVDAAHQLSQLGDAIQVARRELVAIGKHGAWDAIVELRPLGDDGRVARDHMIDVYVDWARWRRMRVDWLREPMADAEPAMLAIHGPWASGYLAGERGLHRLRERDHRSVVAVRVAAWTDAVDRPTFAHHRALKAVGQRGGKIRSRLECAAGLVLQNARTLAENRELAGELAASWRTAPDAGEDIVRRIDLSPFLVRDALTDIATGRPDALGPKSFHELLCRRVDAIFQAACSSSNASSGT